MKAKCCFFKKADIQSKKLVLVNQYNKFVGGIDRNNAMLLNYSLVRKNIKRFTKVAFHFIEEAVLNWSILFDNVSYSLR